MLILSKYQIALAEGAPDAQMIWAMVLIAIVILLMLFGRRILLMIKGKSADEDLDDDEFIIEDEDTKT